MNRLHQCVLIFSTLLASWLGMQAVHEFGHVLGAWLTGGQVATIALHPLTISRTDLAYNPHPLFVVWAGPVVGVTLPLISWGIAARLRIPGTFVLRFFAGFCLIANGLYIAFGSIDRVGDCDEMLRHGSAAWQLWLFGVMTVPAGLWLWNHQGIYFEMGSAKRQVNVTIAYVCLTVCCLLVILGLLIGGN